MIPDNTIAEIRERTDIVALVGQYVTLKKAGTIYKGLCPFHEEKTPSFTVSPTRNTYHCFGCGVHGDSIRFLVESQGRTFPEAVRELAAAAGVEVPEERPVSPAIRAERKRQKDTRLRLLDVQDKLAGYYADQLFGPGGAPARRYLIDRGIDQRTAQAFRLGYASGDKHAFQRFIEARDIERDDLVALGILVAPEAGWSVGGPLWGGYLRFRERLVCPVVDIKGEVTGFSCRILDGNRKVAKYVNSPETPVFTKGHQLYGAYTARTAARRAGRVVLVEGNVDVMMLWQAGLEGTAAPMGTALTDTQVRLVKRLAERVVCVMDGDAAGTKAAFGSLIPFLAEGIQPRAVMLPEGDDPDSYVRREGMPAFEALVAEAAPLLDLFIERTVEDHPADTQGRLAALRALAPALSRLGDPLADELYRAKVAKLLELTPTLVGRAIDEAQAASRAQAERQARRRGGPRPAPSGPQPPSEPAFDGPFEAPFGARPAFVDEPMGPPPPLDAPPPFDPDAAGYGPGPMPEPEAIGLGPASVGETFESAPSAPSTDAMTGAPAPAAPRLQPTGWQSKLFAFLVQYPELVVSFVDRGGHELLTHDGLTVFVHQLRDTVDHTTTPNLDRLLTEIAQRGHHDAVSFLRACQARRPDQTRDTIAQAFAEVFQRFHDDVQRRRKRELQERVRKLTAQAKDSRERTQLLRRLYAEHGLRDRRLRHAGRRDQVVVDDPRAEGAH